METDGIYAKESYADPLKMGEKPSDALAQDNYLTFACRHKFCREICPVHQETRNESHTPYGFNSALFAVHQGVGKFEELGDTFTHCLQCGACEVRCPNTLFMGDYYRTSLTTIDLVRKVRSDLVRAGVGYPGSVEVEKEIQSHLQDVGRREDMLRWAKDLGIQVGTSCSAVLYVSRFTAMQASQTARVSAKLLRAGGLDFAIMDAVNAGLSEPLDVAKEELYKDLVRKDIAKIEEMGAEVVICVDPHDYFFFQRDYVKIFGRLPFRVVFITDILWELFQEGRLKASAPIKKKVTFHDPCTLNKLTNLWQSPRKLLSSIPGIEFVDENHIDQWYYCCGNGVSSFKKLHPDIAESIGGRRLRKAADTGADTLALACPHCWDHFSDVKSRTRSELELANVVELVAQSVGL